MLYSTKPNKHYLSQVVKVNANSDEVTASTLDWKVALNLGSFPPSNLQPGSNHEENT